MGLYEDDRIRNKNLRYNREGITNTGISLKLNNIPITEMVELLVKHGYKVELGHANTISIDRNRAHGDKTINDNSISIII
jgi:hypothetical protein